MEPQRFIAHHLDMLLRALAPDGASRAPVPLLPCTPRRRGRRARSDTSPIETAHGHRAGKIQHDRTADPAVGRAGSRRSSKSLALIRREDFVPPAYRRPGIRRRRDSARRSTASGPASACSARSSRPGSCSRWASHKHESALEIGTGSGYGTALLAQAHAQGAVVGDRPGAASHSPPTTCVAPASPTCA